MRAYHFPAYLTVLKERGHLNRWCPFEFRICQLLVYNGGMFCRIQTATKK